MYESSCCLEKLSKIILHLTAKYNPIQVQHYHEEWDDSPCRGRDIEQK